MYSEVKDNPLNWIDVDLFLLQTDLTQSSRFFPSRTPIISFLTYLLTDCIYYTVVLSGDNGNETGQFPLLATFYLLICDMISWFWWIFLQLLKPVLYLKKVEYLCYVQLSIRWGMQLSAGTELFEMEQLKLENKFLKQILFYQDRGGKTFVP